MNETGFIKGFIKAAVSYGFSEEEAQNILKQAMMPAMNPMGSTSIPKPVSTPSAVPPMAVSNNNAGAPPPPVSMPSAAPAPMKAVPPIVGSK